MPGLVECTYRSPGEPVTSAQGRHQDRGRHEGSDSRAGGPGQGKGTTNVGVTAPLSLFFLAFGFLLIFLHYEICCKYTSYAHWIFNFYIFHVFRVLYHKRDICIMLFLHYWLHSEEIYVQPRTSSEQLFSSLKIPS